VQASPSRHGVRCATGQNEIGISFFPGMVGRPWEPIRPSCFGGRIELPDINDPATPPAAASGGLLPSVSGAGKERWPGTGPAGRRYQRRGSGRNSRPSGRPPRAPGHAGGDVCSRNSPSVWMETMAAGSSRTRWMRTRSARSWSGRAIPRVWTRFPSKTVRSFCRTAASRIAWQRDAG